MAMLEQTIDVKSAAGGDHAAFARLVAATKHAVTSIALGILRDLRASEDVAQEVYVQAWRDLPSLRNADSFLPWIRQLTRNEAMSYARSRQRYERRREAWRPEEEVARSPMDEAISEEERLVLEEALAAMPDDARDVLTLFYREGRSVAQVAHLLGIGESAVKKRLERARNALRADVEARFATVAAKSAVGASFVAAVTGTLAFGAPSTAAAAALAPKLAKASFSLALLPLVAPPVVSLTAGIAVIVLLVRRLVRTAIDDQERRELRSLRDLACALVVAFHVALGASIAVIPIFGRVVGLAFVFWWLAFGIGGGYLLGHRLPVILARRRALEREADPRAFALAEARRRSRAHLVLALSLTAFSVAFGLVICR